MSGWFASVGDRVRYELPDVGGWIELRKELSIKEERDAFANAVRGTVPLENGEMRIEYDQSKLSFGLVLSYLADWSEKAPITHSAVGALKPEIYALIEQKVNEHVETLGKKPKGKTEPKTSGAPTLPSAA